MTTLIPTPPAGKLQEKKAALLQARNLLPQLQERVAVYARLNTRNRVPHRQTPRPALKAIYDCLQAYPFGLFANPLNFTEPMMHRADSRVSSCLGALRTGHINGLFTAGDYEQLCKHLTSASDLIDEVYFIETQRPRPLKVGNRPNANRATPETRAQAVIPKPPVTDAATVDKPKAGKVDMRPIQARVHDLRSALDDLVTVEQTGLIEDFAGLLGGLDAYPYDLTTQRDEPFVMVADGLVTSARGVCWQTMRTNQVTPNGCALIRRDLEKALSLLEHCLLP